MQRHKKSMTVDVLEVLRSSWREAPGGVDAKMLCTLGFFGFMRSGEFTVPSTRGFNLDIHLSRQDVASDSVTNPIMVHNSSKDGS